MPPPKLEDFALLEKLALSFLSSVASAVSEALAAPLAEVPLEQRNEALERIVWQVACHLEQRSVGALEDGRPILSSLGFVAFGSESAFEQPFVEHEGVLTAGRIALHEYVHAAVEQASGPGSNAA